MKIYVVTSECYSDFHIDAVFSTRKAAQEYIDVASFSCDGNEITECDVDVASVKPPTSMNVWGYFNKDVFSAVLFSLGEAKSWSFYGNGIVNFHGNVTVRPGETAEDFRERAKKVCTDKYFEWKARQHG